MIKTKRMRTFLSALCLLCLVCCAALPGARAADTAPQDEVLPESIPGFVLCESLTVRKSPELGSKRVLTVSYGASLAIEQTLRNTNLWYGVSVIDAQGVTSFGWVLADYVLESPVYHTVTEETPAYAFPAEYARCIAVLLPGESLPVIAEIEGYLVVSLHAASAFIRLPPGNDQDQ